MKRRADKAALRREGQKTGGPNKAPPKRPGYVSGDQRKGAVS